jgi:hypothetical protein
VSDSEPGGVFYFAEFHPFHNVMGDDDLVVEHPYFHTEPMRWEEGGTYAELGAPPRATSPTSGTTPWARW